MPQRTVLTGPPGPSTREPFFARVLEWCTDVRRASRLRYIVPTARRRVATERAILESCSPGAALARPLVVTLDRFVQTLFVQHTDRRVISWPIAALVVESILSDAPARFPTLLGARTVPFAGLVRAIVHAIREIKRFAVDPARLRTAARTNAKVAELVDVLDAYNAFRDEKQWADARDTFPLVAAALADPAVARRWLAGVDWIVLDGFVELSPSELPIVKSLMAHVETTCVFDRDAELGGVFVPLPALGVEAATRTDSSPFVPVARVALGHAEAVDAAATAGVRIIEAETREDEAEAVASEVKRLLAEGVAQRDVAIAVPDVRQYAPLVEGALAAHGVPCASARRGSVLETPVAAAIIGLLETAARDFVRADVVESFGSPLVRFGDAGDAISSGALDALARDMRIFRGKDAWLDGVRRRIAHLESQAARLGPDCSDEEGAASAPTAADLGRLRSLAEPLRQALDALDALRAPRPAVEWFRQARNLVERFGIARQVQVLAAATEHGPAHVRALRSLEAAFDEGDWFAQAYAASRPLTLDEFIEALRTSLAELAHSAAAPDSGVEVLDVRTAVERRTRHLFVMGLVEGAVPVRRRHDTLLPPDVRAAVGLPSAERLASEAAVELYRALASTDEQLTLSRPTLDKDTQLLPALAVERIAAALARPRHMPPAPPTSLQGLLCALGRCAPSVPSLDELRSDGRFGRMPALHAFAHGEAVLTARSGSPATPTPYAGRLSAPFLEELRRRYRPEYQFSATELETYARCPFRFFAARVLRLEEPLEPEEEITPLDKGTVLHAIFRDFYRRWLGRGEGRITQANASAALALLRTVADEHLGALPYQGAVWQKFRQRVAGQEISGTLDVPGLLERFLDVEIGALGASGLRPRHFELSFGDHARREHVDVASTGEPLPIEARGRRVLMQGAIDRVDTDQERNTFCVLDYKSGSAIPRLDEVRGGSSLQLPVYALAARMLLGAQYRLAAAGYYQTKDAADCGLRNVIHDASLAKAGAAPPTSKAAALEPAEIKEWLDAEAALITDLVLGIEAGRFEVTALDEVRADCRSCDFKHICRYRGITLRTFERQS